MFGPGMGFFYPFSKVAVCIVITQAKNFILYYNVPNRYYKWALHCARMGFTPEQRHAQIGVSCAHFLKGGLFCTAVKPPARIELL